MVVFPTFAFLAIASIESSCTLVWRRSALVAFRIFLRDFSLRGRPFPCLESVLVCASFGASAISATASSNSNCGGWLSC